MFKFVTFVYPVMRQNRRAFVKGFGGLIAGGSLAGCTQSVASTRESDSDEEFDYIEDVRVTEVVNMDGGEHLSVSFELSSFAVSEHAAANRVVISDGQDVHKNDLANGDIQEGKTEFSIVFDNSSTVDDVYVSVLGSEGTVLEREKLTM